MICLSTKDKTTFTTGIRGTTSKSTYILRVVFQNVMSYGICTTKCTEVLVIEITSPHIAMLSLALINLSQLWPASLSIGFLF